MPHKVNVSDSGKHSLSEQELSKGKGVGSDSSSKGKTVKLELEDTGVLSGKSIGDVVKGEDVDPKLAGFELVVSGGSDKSGLPMSSDVEGIGLKRVLFKEKGWGMHDARKGVRLRKTVRGKTISGDIVQVNLSVTKSGSGKLGELFKSSDGSEGADDNTEEQPGGGDSAAKEGDSGSDGGQGGNKNEVGAKDDGDGEKKGDAPKEEMKEDKEKKDE